MLEYLKHTKSHRWCSHSALVSTQAQISSSGIALLQRGREEHRGRRLDLLVLGHELQKPPALVQQTVSTVGGAYCPHAR